LVQHECLALRAQRGWTLKTTDKERMPDAESTVVKISGRFECNDGAVLHEWALAGRGLAWRSWWEVGAEVRAGKLVTLLDDYAAAPVGIYAVFAQRRHLPVRVRLFVDLLKETYGKPAYWNDIASV
jgi:DNA-binding transcriptional LysR family regulator